jgi:uncharacterized protein (DUF1800 family)
MTQAMVDRLFWRAGFGPSAADRQLWTGKSVYQAVDWLLGSPAGGLGAPPPASRNGAPLDPTSDDRDLVLAWLDRMLRASNPLVERMTFFWHRHFANSRDDVSPPQLVIGQNELFRRYADLGANPAATVRNLTYEVGESPSMLRYLTGEDSNKRAPNENYGRELMELFLLGVTNAQGQPNYTETDVKELAKSFTGWQINDDDPDHAFSYFNRSRWFDGPKTVLGKVGNFQHRDAVDVVLSQPAHAPFLLTILWGEFIASPPDAATVARLTSTYLGSGLEIRPVLRRILTHPLLFESLDEPNLIKPPVVYVAGMMKALGVGVTSQLPYDLLDDMGQLPYFPPTVAGWEGGTAWLNTNTALSRFLLANKLVNLPQLAPQDVPGEAPDPAVTRAHQAVGSPWIAAGTRSALLAYAGRAPTSTAAQRKARQLVLRTLILGGPDGQVM